MKYRGRRESDNVIDIRTNNGANGGASAGNSEVRPKGKSNPILGCLIVLILGGGGFIGILAGAGGSSKKSNASTTNIADTKINSDKHYSINFGSNTSVTEEYSDVSYIKVALADNEDVWHKIFEENGMTYSEPKLVLYTDEVETGGCGREKNDIGAFYCSGDQRIYFDPEDYFKNMRDGGDFAMAYVIAHEVGHHIQYLLGTMDEVAAKEANLSKKERNKLSIPLELQADFYAGVWAHHTQKMNGTLEDGDIEEAINLMRETSDDGRGVAYEDKTHGTSSQGVYWFKKGYETGDISKGTTFDDLEVE